MGCAPVSPPEAPTIVVEPSGGDSSWSVAAEPALETHGSRPGDAPPIEWRDDPPVLSAGPVLLWIRADWDPTSVLLERELWSRPDVRSALRGWGTYRVDVTEASPATEHLLARYAVARVPVVLVLRDGREEARLEGAFDVASLLEHLRG